MPTGGDSAGGFSVTSRSSPFAWIGISARRKRDKYGCNDEEPSSGGHSGHGQSREGWQTRHCVSEWQESSAGLKKSQGATTDSATPPCPTLPRAQTDLSMAQRTACTESRRCRSWRGWRSRCCRHWRRHSVGRWCGRCCRYRRGRRESRWQGRRWREAQGGGT